MTRKAGFLSVLTAAVAATGISTGMAHAEKLVVWAGEQMSNPVVAEGWNKLKADFEAQNPGITVEYMLPTGMIDNGAVQAAIQSDAGPDVLLTNSGLGRMTTVVKAKLVRPLTTYYEEHGWKDQIFPWLYDVLKGQFGGEIYEVPDGFDAIGLWYHKDLFEKNGWKIGGSWADFEALLAKMKEAGIEPLVVGPRKGANGGHLAGNFFQAAAGTDAMGEVVRGKRPWTDAQPLLGAQRIADFVSKGYINQKMAGLDQDAATRMWVNKRAGIFFGGPWFITSANTLGYDLNNLGYATIPSDVKGASIPTGGIGWSWMIPTSSKQPELAVKWLDFVLSDEIMRYRFEHPSGNTLRPRALEGAKPHIPVMAEVAAAAAGGIGYNPSVYIPGAALGTYYQVIQGLIGGQVSPQEGLAEIQAQIK